MKHLFSELYWSPLGAPLRVLFPKPPVPPSNTAHWDSEVSGKFAARLGGTLSIDQRNHTIATLLAHSGVVVRSVLDIGCAGATLRNELPYFAKYMGVDISQHALGAARAQHPTCDFDHGTVESFVPTQLFDVIVLSEVLYYTDYRDVVANVQRYLQYLNPGGVLCISLNLKNPKARAMERALKSALRYVSGFIYQEKVSMDSVVRKDCARPLYHTYLARGL